MNIQCPFRGLILFHLFHEFITSISDQLLGHFVSGVFAELDNSFQEPLFLGVLLSRYSCFLTISKAAVHLEASINKSK